MHCPALFRPFRAFSRLPLAIALAAPLLAGCGGEDPAPPANGGTSTRGNVLLADDNNYTSTSALTIETIDTAPGVDIEICWGGLVDDLQCHDVIPEEHVDNVGISIFEGKEQAEITSVLTAGELDTDEVKTYYDFQPDHVNTCMQLSQMSFLSEDIDLDSDYVESDDRVYLLLFAKGTVPGVGSHTMVYLRPTADSDVTTISAPVGCGMLDFTANLPTTLAPVPADGPWVLDWKDVTRDALMNDFAYARVDSLILGFYEDMTVADVEEGFFDIREMATSLWEMPMRGQRTADLKDAVLSGTDGETFAGFTQTNGVWLMALLCSTCQNPQPLLLTVLEPT